MATDDEQFDVGSVLQRRRAALRPVPVGMFDAPGFGDVFAKQFQVRNVARIDFSSPSAATVWKKNPAKAKGFNLFRFILKRGD